MPTRTTARTRAAHVVRGALIGAAEAVPGVSGGTVALVTGVYEAVITSAGHLVSAAKAVFTDRARARAELRGVRWDVLVPLLLGMAPTLVIALLLLGPAIEDHPVPMRALFLGMVLAALVVPLAMLGGRWRVREVATAVLAAAAAFVLIGLPERTVEPALPAVFLAASFAVCALVLPGVSGSFLLLAIGLYVPTSEAVRDLDLAYIGVFVLGAAVGLAVIVKGLQWLLEHRHRITLAAMTGLIVGALRALWPWQTDDRELLAPDGQVGLSVGLVVLGAAVVLTVYLIERRARASRDDHGVLDATRRRHAEKTP
jgi:putative membrane protein